MFIWILYMFRTTLCSSSGGQLYEYNFWYNHSVLVAVRTVRRSRWNYSAVPSWPAYRTATNTRVIIPDVSIQLSSWRWAQGCSKHLEDSNKHIIEEIVRQVGYLSESVCWISCIKTSKNIGAENWLFWIPVHIEVPTRNFVHTFPIYIYNFIIISTLLRIIR